MAADSLTHSTSKSNSTLVIFSVLSSHCWRSNSSITLEIKKTLPNNFNNTKLSSGSEMRSYAVPAHLQLPHELPHPQAEETAATSLASK